MSAAEDLDTIWHHNPLPLLWFRDIEPVLDAKDFVQGVLLEGGATVVYGESNSGKTFFTTDLALHIAAGLPWNGRRVDRGGVIYCVLEGGAGFRNRIHAWKCHHGLDDADIPFAAIACSLNLLNPDADTPRLIDAIKAAADAISAPVKLVVIDTLARAFAGGNENSSEDMGALILNIDRIRAATGANALFVHHCGKDQAKGSRGHSSLRAAIDTEIEVTASPETESHSANIVKQRELKKGDIFNFSLDVIELGENRHGEKVTTCIVSVPNRDTQGHFAGAPLRNKNVPMSPTGTTALKLLERAMSKTGTLAPNTMDYPRGVSVVSADDWRREFYLGGKPGEPQETKKKAFQRGREELINKGVVASFNDLVWFTAARTDHPTK